MRWLLSLSLVLGFVACDSPGSGTPCVDCGLPDGFVRDVFDARDDIDTRADTEITLPDVSDDATPIECLDGLTRCVGELVETSINGHFVATQQCESNQICRNGACRANECASGVTECRDAVVRTCTDGLWQTVESCQYGCDGGTTCAVRGSDQCAEIWRCVEEARCIADNNVNQGCVDQCKLEGTGETGAEVQLIADCFDECSGNLTCIVQYCIPKLTSCRFPRTGNGTCDALSNCVAGCFTDQCVTTCYSGASRDAQTTYMQWANCDRLVCGGSSGCPDCQAYRSTCLFEEP
jgi:hypothetical protein